MPRFSIFIKDLAINGPYVGVARVVVEADDEAGARSKAVETYDSVAVGRFTAADVQFAARIADPDDSEPRDDALDTWRPTGAIKVL